MGIPASQTLEIIIQEDGKVHVIHNVIRNSSPQQLDVIDGTVSNLVVVDINGNDVQYASTGLGVLQGVSVFPTRENFTVEYDLEDALVLKNKMWVWNYSYNVDTVFIFPEKSDLIFFNGNPINLYDKKGIKCHGCSALLEFVLDEPILIEEVVWEEKKFKVKIRTLADITSFNFDQPSKRISFDINSENQFVTLKIPLELLWNPYDVFLTNNATAKLFYDLRISNHEKILDEDYISLSFKPKTSGTIHIVGTTVVPEFPYFMPLFFGIIMVVAIQFRKKINLR